MQTLRSLLVLMLLQITSVGARADAPLVPPGVTTAIESAKSKCGSSPPYLDTFTKIICSGSIQIGVRVNYTGFGVFADGRYSGYEIDLAREIARALGVSPVLVPVTPANRIALLLEGKVDLILATMGHIASRAKAVEFIEPHYYASGFAVVAPRQSKISNLTDLSGRSICVPLGSYSNAVIAASGARLMMFDRPDRMISALRLGACTMIAHDEPLLFASVTGPTAPSELQSRFEQKFSFATVPWGMAVRHPDGETLGPETLGAVIRLLLIQYHRDGYLMRIAAAHGIKTEFLVEQNRLWNDASCLSSPTPGGLNARCVLPAVDLDDPPTSIAPIVTELQSWLQSVAQLKLTFPMLTNQASAQLFLRGLTVSLAFIIATIIFTLLFSVGFFLLLSARHAFSRLVGRVLVNVLINSPVILLLVLGYLVVTSFFPYNYWLAGAVGLLMIGLNNGAVGGIAAAETAQTLPEACGLTEVAVHARTQLRACVINAVKASPVAAFIGVPDLLSSLVHISSFTGERSTTYLLVTIFYIVAVQAVVVGSSFIVNRWGSE